MTDTIPFTKQMRIATREVHSLSDALINAKLGVALTSSRVWAEGLLVFYEIFKWLEETLDVTEEATLHSLDVAEMRRTELFEKDLLFYLGKDWKESYTIRESVSNYIKHLEELKHSDPVLLSAYIYHLYMGLLSGGQILRRKHAMVQKLKFSRHCSYEGLAVTEINGATVYQIKEKINAAMNSLAADLDDETRGKLIEESKMVFILNDKMVRSIEGTREVVIWNVLKFSAISVAIGLASVYIKKYFLG